MPEGEPPTGEIAFLWETPPLRYFPWKMRLQNMARHIFCTEGYQGGCNIILCSDYTVRSLNLEFRKLDKVTDVLSFNWEENPEFLGEIYIARNQVFKQAPLYGNSFYQELRRVMVHGILHLLGYDHMRHQQRSLMRKREEFYLGSSPYATAPHGKYSKVTPR